MPNCIKDSKSKYKGNEPSPKGLGYCAHSEKNGTKMRGKDGKNWIIKSTNSGIKRWIKLRNDDKKEKGKKYYIHDNGSLPFEVIINKNGDVFIYKKNYSIKYPEKTLDNDIPYSILIQKFKPKKIHIGKDKKVGKNGIGNSILLEMPKNKFICITESIFQFDLEPGDEIVKYFSLIGNSDVPYPVLLGKNNFYSMVDKTYASRNYFPQNWKINDYEDGHGFYYGEWKLGPKKKHIWESQVKDKKKLINLKTISPRQF